MATRTPPPQGNITPNDVEFDQIRLRRQAKFNVLASINSRIFIGNGAALYISYFHKSTFYIYMSSLLLQITPKVQSLRHSGLRTVAQRLADSGTAACGQWHSGLRTVAQRLADSGTAACRQLTTACGQRHSGLQTVAQRLADSGTAACEQRHSGLRTVAPFIQWWRSRPHSSAFASAVVAIFAEPALVSVWLLSTCHLARSSLQDILHRTMSN